MASVAAPHASTSSTQGAAHAAMASENTDGIVTQAQPDNSVQNGTLIRDENEEMRQHLEMAGRTIKASSASSNTPQVEELHSKLEHVQAELNSMTNFARGQYKSIMDLKEELNDERRRVYRRDKTIERLNGEIILFRHNTRVENCSQDAVIEEKEEIVSQLKKKLKTATEENASLKASLEDCKERIFKLQPFEAKSDSEIASLYVSLCETVISWVANLFDEFGHTGEIANGAATVAAITALTQGRPSVYGDRLKALLGPNPSSDEVMLSSLIIHFLHGQVLPSSSLCLGLNQGAKDFVHRIMSGLSQLETPKDPESIGMWRVDTYRAVSIMPEVIDEQKVLKGKYINALLDCIKAIAPDAIDEPCRKASQQAVEEAVSLAHEIQLTTATYGWVSMEEPEREPMPLHGRELQNYKLVDIKTGLMLKRSSIKEHTEDAVIGEKLSCVFPALVREIPKEDKELTLAKETILVQIYDEFRHKKQKRTEVGTLLMEG